MPQFGTMSLHHAQMHYILTVKGTACVQICIHFLASACDKQQLHPYLDMSLGDNVYIAWRSVALRQQTPWAHDMLVTVVSSVHVKLRQIHDLHAGALLG